MPNGGHWGREEWAAVERFFEGIGPTLERFARTRNLKIEKYYHDSPSWSFLFRHPRGGVAKIEVERAGKATARVHTTWWVDDYRQGTRFSRWQRGKELPVIEITDGGSLAGALRTVLGWSRRDLAPDSGHKNTWQRQWTEEEFAELARAYPKPTAG